MLTVLEVAGMKPGPKPYKRFDRNGLYLMVTPAGGRIWRWKYRLGGKENVLVLGHFPKLSLKGARDKVKEARDLLDAGIDPADARRRERAGLDVATIDGWIPTERSLEIVAREWWAERKKSERWDEGYAVQVLSQLERDLFPIQVTRGLPAAACRAHPLLSQRVGAWALDAVTPVDVLEICRNVEARGSLDAARDLRSRIGMVYQREQVLGRCAVNPAQNVTALLAKPKRTNHAAISFDELPEFFVRFEAENLDPTTRFGIEGILATWLRSTELRLAQWSWLDWNARELRIPSECMKNGDRGRGDHIVPLSDYAIAVFRRLNAATGRREMMFPSLKHRGQAISDGAWLNALYRMGYRDKATVHGIRALGSTSANEAYVRVPNVPVPIKMWEARWIDRQLDHVDKSVSGVYNRADYLEPRRALMHWWGEQLQSAREAARSLVLPQPGSLGQVMLGGLSVSAASATR